MMMKADLEAWLVDLQPLRRAEQLLLKALLQDDIARIGLRRPDAAHADLTVRAALIARLAAGAGAVPRLRRLQLLGAWIEGVLDLGDLPVPAALWFYRCVFESAPRLDGARCAGGVSFGDCLLPGLFAPHSRIALDLSVHAGCSVGGELRLDGARIGGDLRLSRTRLHDDAGHALRRPLSAERARIGGDLRLDEGFEAHGELRLVGARIRGSVIAGGARLVGPVDGHGVRQDALVMDRAKVGGDVQLDQGFAAAGRVCLRRAQIGGDLDCSGAGFDHVGDASWGDGAALVLDRARVHGALRLCRLQGPLAGASFAGTRVGTLVDDASSWGERLVLDGFAYARFGDGAPLDAPFRLAWLERQPGAHLAGDFRHHPWRRLIAVLARMGELHSAGEIALRRERRLRTIGRIGRSFPSALRWIARGAHLLYGLGAGYGWRPQRLAAALFAVWLVCAAAYWAAPRPAAPDSRALEPLVALAYSADRLLPLPHAMPSPARAGRAEAPRVLDGAAGLHWLARFESLLGLAALLALGLSWATKGRREAGR